MKNVFAGQTNNHLHRAKWTDKIYFRKPWGHNLYLFQAQLLIANRTALLLWDIFIAYTAGRTLRFHTCVIDIWHHKQQGCEYLQCLDKDLACGLLGRWSSLIQRLEKNSKSGSHQRHFSSAFGTVMKWNLNIRSSSLLISLTWDIAASKSESRKRSLKQA